MTNVFGQSDKFSVYKVAEAESGFNYYVKIHITGQVLVMRETVAGTEYKYANGGFNPELAYTNRVSLEYKNINQL